jgi:hypothetical protein
METIMNHHRMILFAAIALALTGTPPVFAQGLSVGGGADVGVKGSLPSAPEAGADVNAGAGADADVSAGPGGASADVQGKGSADADVDTKVGGAGAELKGKGNIGADAEIE